ncbi:MAG: hypothetical protein K8S87_10950, partial [Planctomycetes bacterium]|nr:hypothetical protein [Planctomycetota bacterium]
MANTVYIIIFAVYIVFMLIIGMYFKKRTQTSKDYFHGGGIGAWVTALSFVAAYFSTVLIVGGGGWGYQQGLSTVWIGVGNVVVGCFLAWIVLGPRLRIFSHRLNTMTIPEFLEKRFDSSFVRLYSSIIIVIFLVVYNSSVAQGMGEIFSGFIGFDYWISVLICGAVIAIYVTFGGYLSVVWTAMIQAIIMIAALSIMAIYALNDAGGLGKAVDTLSKIDVGKYNLVDAPGPWGWGSLIGVILTVSLGVWAMPQLLIRFYSIKSVKVLKVGTIVVTIGGAFAILAYFNGAMTRAVYPDNKVFLTETEEKNIDTNVEKSKVEGKEIDRNAIVSQYLKKNRVD